MWGMITQLELATASVGGMDALSPLGVGLVGLIWLAVGLLAWMAAHDLCLKSPSLWLRSAGPAGGSANTVFTDHETIVSDLPEVHVGA